MQKNTLLTGFRAMMAVVVLLTTARAWAVEVNVEKAGTLSTLIAGTEADLKLTGSINGTDVKCLRQLINDGKLTSLDLSEVHIVSGGEAYYESFKTQNDVIGESMFTGCAKLRTIVLPSTVTEILKNAFSRSGIRKVDIPNSVSHLGGDAFAYCSSLATVVIGSRVTRLDQGVFYSSSVSMAYVKPLTPPSTPAYLFSSKPT
ncbi:MAG: leucine-rich repeat domain-containing protein, partial [Bacteroidaceae bacterium]|nr:leucine-rich repeat domain-containing protein [Bacteroidaceae bacterium]